MLLYCQKLKYQSVTENKFLIMIIITFFFINANKLVSHRGRVILKNKFELCDHSGTIRRVSCLLALIGSRYHPLTQIDYYNNYLIACFLNDGHIIYFSIICWSVKFTTLCNFFKVTLYSSSSDTMIPSLYVRLV